MQNQDWQNIGVLSLKYRDSLISTSTFVDECRRVYNRNYKFGERLRNSIHVMETDINEFAIHPIIVENIESMIEKGIDLDAISEYRICNLIESLLVYRNMDFSCDLDQYDTTVETASDGEIYMVCDTNDHFFDIDGRILPGIYPTNRRPATRSEIERCGFSIFRNELDQTAG